MKAFIVISLISYAVTILPSLTHPYFQRKINEIRLVLNKRIYEHALHLDYQYIDNPKYYDKYTWAMDEYFQQTSSALRFLANFGRYVAAIAVLVALIASIGPWILLLEAKSTLLAKKHWIDMKRQGMKMFVSPSSTRKRSA